MISIARASEAPITIRSGWRKSLTADPSRRNSGLETMEKSTCPFFPRMISEIIFPVPVGTVDLVTTTL